MGRLFAAFKLRQVLIDDARRRAVRKGTAPLADESGSQMDAGVRPASAEASPAEAAQWQEVHEAVGRLPADQREVVEMHLYLGLSQAEIAGQLGLAPKAVSRLWNAALLALSPHIPAPD